MGAIWAKWRKRPSTSEALSSLEGDITRIESFRRDTAALQRKVLGHFIAYFTVLYFLAAVFAYFRFWGHPDWRDVVSQLKLAAPFLVAPFIFMIVKRVLTWWYHRKIQKNEVKLADLKKQKTKILNEVMEKETYKVAKEILEKYAPEQLSSKTALSKTLPVPSLTPRSNSSPSSPTHAARTPMVTNTGTAGNNELRRRLNATGKRCNPTPLATAPSQRRPGPALNVSQADVSFSARGNESLVVSGGNGPQFGVRGVPSGPPLPRPILPRERSYMDRMVEYLVGEGPNNRYALICKQCQSHNGMALKEEFEYIAYRCCYCHYWNPARKERPVAPRLPQAPQLATLQRNSSTESTSEEDDVPDRKANPITTNGEESSQSNSGPKESADEQPKDDDESTQAALGIKEDENAASPSTATPTEKEVERELEKAKPDQGSTE